MYFQIENTPENVKRARKKEKIQEAIQEECPRLILAPFSRPPQVIFDNVTIGTSCEKELELLNPTKQAQQITLGKSLPPGLVIHLPEECLEVEPETCYCVCMEWTPTQLTSLRETIRFTNDNRGRYDVIVVMKSVMPAKAKGNQQKFKISPGKIKKRTAKKSPVAIYKKKIEAVRSTVTVKKTVNVVQSTQYKIVKQTDKENNYPHSDYSIDSNYQKCPFDSPSSLDFNTSEVFSNMLRPKAAILHDTYDKSYRTLKDEYKSLPVPNNILKPSNKQVYDNSASDVFDNLTFTPLKSIPSKNEKLDNGPRIIISVNSESDFEDSVDIRNSNKENETHSIICITSSQQPSKWLTADDPTHTAHCNETPITNKKIPNTSSPKDLNSPNFSINTDFSRISELSFFPQRFSTERKTLPKNNETHEIVDDSSINVKLSSDTYTKESPNTPLDYRVNKMSSDFRHLPTFVKEPFPKMCRQSLFKEQQNYKEAHERNYLAQTEHYPWHSDLRAEVRSPPRSLTPPLQSIPEESVQLSDTQVLDKHAATFTINQTFDRPSDISSMSVTRQSTWSKKAVRAEPALWKTPAPVTKKPAKSKTSIKAKESLSNQTNITLDTNTTLNQSSYLNYVGNVYSQSTTVDPFLSSTYYYDKDAVENLEKEFKRWLNCVLTPPADLDSNIEQKIDVGKAWIENRNKEVPLAPTKEQVCSTYHNSHRLESLRRSARALLRSPEINQVFLKLQAQIEKKLIAIRNDKNLHLDIGLQRIIMEIILSYNPLWLRIGLEAIYGLVLPLKSNNDIEGLTTFIIQRMFKKPNLKNKHSKTSAPNMLLPAYMESIKKFTLKKFFILVFFLDQAKQKKMIPHDPCLFRRNALCKESKEIIINFTKELIAGIGDITRHLRPLGYVVSHKQCYLDEYIYAVHNIAVDIRDGVRLTKVMEIILMRKGLLHQLRTPAISRLQKIHNVQVALNALKEANFVIVGDITAADIADGHREKTLSLLWQLIHVFRAPLFERAANVIQIWWRKKYEVIVEKRREEERLLAKLNTAASIIQYWWRRVQYNRMVDQQMQKITTVTIVIQKYWRMWLCRSRLRKLKSSAVKISEFYRSIKLKRQAIETLQLLRAKRLELRRKSATIIQAHLRRWLCLKKYKTIQRNVILIQSFIRRYLVQKRYNSLKKSVTLVQQKYRGKILMRQAMQNLVVKKACVVLIQSYYRMSRQQKYYKNLKKAVLTVEKHYKALILMRCDRLYHLKLKQAVIKAQASYKRNRVRQEYLRQRKIFVNLQRRVRANQAMKKDKLNYLKIRNAAIVIQIHTRANQAMKVARAKYISQRNAAILIQRYHRAYLQKKIQRSNYLLLRKSVIEIQTRYRNLLLMRCVRNAYRELRNAVLLVQRRYRARILMREIQNKYQELKKAAIVMQKRYIALQKMREERRKFMQLKSSCIKIQHTYRAHLKGNQQRKIYIRQKESAIEIQRWYRALKKAKEVKLQYLMMKQSCTTIQKMYRAYIAGKKQRQEYIKIRTATMCIQTHYRNYLLTKTLRKEYLEIRKSTIVIQQFYRSWLETIKHRQTYLKIRHATVTIQVRYRQYRVAKTTREEYCRLKLATICIQQRYRSIIAMRKEREVFMNLKRCTTNIQKRYRALQAMRRQRLVYLRQRSAIITIQNRFRALSLMKRERSTYLRLLQAFKTIQMRYRAYRKCTEQRKQYLLLKDATIKIQQRFRAIVEMRKERQWYLQKRAATLVIQRRFRARQMMIQERAVFIKTVTSCITIQQFYKARLIGTKQRETYIGIRSAAIIIQKRWREYRVTKIVRNSYIQLRNVTISIQRHVRAKNEARMIARKMAADKIQTWYISIMRRNECRSKFIDIRTKIITLQANLRSHVCRKRYLSIRQAALTIQRCYRSYKLAKSLRENYVRLRWSLIKLQAHVRGFIQKKRYFRLRTTILTIQAVYRFKKHRALMQKRREEAAICIQKNVRRYLAQSRYKRFSEKLIFVQNIWRSKLITRLIRCEFMQKKRLITKLQAAIRGYLARKEFESRKESLLKLKEEKRQNWAASKIQALFRAHKTRVSGCARAAELRRRWRKGALQSTQESLQERNEDALEVLSNMSDIESVIRAFKSLELLTEVMPMMYDANASLVVRCVYVYMSVMNRSISSVEVLKSGAAVLVNLTRYRRTGPKIYLRDRITQALKFMWRFCNSETQLFCILSTYIWLFSKYDAARKDLTEFLRIPENHKMLVTIKGNVSRMKRMAQNTRNNNVFHTPQPSKFVSHTRNGSSQWNQSLRDSGNLSICSNSSNSSLLPALEPDYGIARVDRPRYFEDAQQAINCLFEVYSL
ncbi:protein abnormal spindle [Pararge aegeria]|uniref:protein abnormal spindle n=1 Tax=Pararge aegeria TaxID=116150 RepID=UPI0019CF5A57|nr:protein abnormal spindle [Pararge aegeria]